MPEDSLPLLNVYEVLNEDGKTRHLLTFLSPDRVETSGIQPRYIVGEVTPTDFGGFDPLSLQLNPQFIQALATYMNEVVGHTPEIATQARSSASEWTYIIDPRNRDEPGVEPPPVDFVGAFAVDESGQIVHGSFVYNQSHTLVDPERGYSGIFTDRRFYDWLHSTEEPSPDSVDEV
ncbi:hypothetical protein P12x_004128 [Tundrisphaera lichenicola]|uniref:hypothetical protein n=1 Tax=Tundrisphaera lichenicola TaxID=2029860 RepID=UPI003EBBE097